MRKTALVIVVAALLLTSACATQQQTGTAVGAGVGAATGAALGAAIGRSGTAALIGAGAGALAGGIAGNLIGSYMDKQEADMRNALAAQNMASVQREQDNLAITFRSDVMFDVNSAYLKPGAMTEMDRVAQVLNRYPQTRIRVEGHTDSTGSPMRNQTLSEERAMSVKQALAARGVDPMRIETIGYGPSRPIATNANEGGRQLNRRVNILIIPIRS